MRGKKGGRHPRICNFPFFLVYSLWFISLVPLFGGQRRRRRGCPAMIGNPDLGQEKVM